MATFRRWPCGHHRSGGTGEREVLGVGQDRAEDTVSWLDFLRSLVIHGRPPRGPGHCDRSGRGYLSALRQSASCGTP